MTLEEDFKYRQQTINYNKDILGEIIKDVDKIDALIVGVRFNNGVYRLSNTGNIIDRYGLVALMSHDIDDIRKEIDG